MKLIATSLFLAVAVFMFSGTTAAQESVPTLHVETRVMQVDVVVTDPQGHSVGDLSKEQFTLLDNGKVRAIDIFSVSDGEPIPIPPSQPLPPNVFSNRNHAALDTTHTTVILLDASPANPKANEFALWQNARGQAVHLIQSLQDDERIALFVVSRQEGMLLLQDFTSDRELLMRSLNSYDPRTLHPNLSPWTAYQKEQNGPDMGSSAAGTESPRRDPNLVPASEMAYLMNNAVRENRLSLQTIAERLALVPGRKNVYWATAGFSSTLMHDMGAIPWEHTIDALNEASVAVSTGSCQTASIELAARTGGTAPCDGGAKAESLIAASRVTYTLGFYLADSERDDTFHSLKVRVARPGVQLYYRQGFDASKTPGSLREKKPELESVLANQVDSTGVGITARIEKAAGKVTLQLNLDPETLSLNKKAGGWSGNIEEMLVEMNERGNTLAKVSDRKEFDVASNERGRYESDGVTWPMSMPLAAGTTRIAIVVRDTKSGHLGSLTIPVN